MTPVHFPCDRHTPHPPHNVSKAHPDLMAQVAPGSVELICPGVMSESNPHNAWSDVLRYPYAIEQRYARENH